MAPGSFLKCFKGFVYENASLIEAKLTIFDLQWNLVILLFSIFEIIRIGCIVTILHIIWGYFNMFGSILNNFYDVDVLVIVSYDQCNWYRYEASIILIIIKLQSTILLFAYKIRLVIVLLHVASWPCLLEQKGNCIKIQLQILQVINTIFHLLMILSFIIRKNYGIH